MISSTSLRLPQKTCGLFDTGLAGGADTASTSCPTLAIQTDGFAQTLFSLEDLHTFGQAADQVATQPATTTTINPAAVKALEVEESVPAVDWPADLLDPLGGLEDPLGDDSLDAFVDLEQFLMGDTFLDDCEVPATGDNLIQLKPSVEQEVTPVIEITPEPVFVPVPVVATKPSVTKTQSRKRKAGKSSRKALTTSMFEIPEGTSSDDHDYTAKQKRVSPPEETVLFTQTATTSGTSLGKATSNNDDKQAVRRMKNNVASKRSREQRKAKFVEMDQEAEFLTQENERLREKISELEKTAKEMKALLVAKMAGKA